MLAALPSVLRALGFVRDSAQSFHLELGRHRGSLWVQKFSRMPAFRMCFSFTPAGMPKEHSVVEFSDAWERREKRYNFTLGHAPDTVERCVQSMEAFAREVVIPWLQQAAQAQQAVPADGHAPGH